MTQMVFENFVRHQQETKGLETTKRRNRILIKDTPQTIAENEANRILIEDTPQKAAENKATPIVETQKIAEQNAN